MTGVTRPYPENLANGLGALVPKTREKTIIQPVAGPLRPARMRDLHTVHPMLLEAISSSPFYGETFKAHEKSRLSKAYLAALLRADPRHVMLIMKGSEIAGFMLSGPELGALWLYWSYIRPESRGSTLAMGAMRAFPAQWENGHFHKISTLTKPDNKVSRVLMERYGYSLVANLKSHIFGEDYLLYEHPLTKRIPGYDRGIATGHVGRLVQGLRSLFRV